MLYRKQENPQLILYWHLITQMLCNPQEVIFQLCSVWVRSSLKHCVSSFWRKMETHWRGARTDQQELWEIWKTWSMRKGSRNCFFKHFFSSRKTSSWDETWWKTFSTLSITGKDDDELCHKGNGENGFSFYQRLDIRKHLLLGKSGTGEKHPELVLWLELFKDETDTNLQVHGVGKVFSWYPFQPCVSVIYGLSVTELCWSLRLQSSPRHQRLHLERFTGWPSAKQISVPGGEGISGCHSGLQATTDRVCCLAH